MRSDCHAAIPESRSERLAEVRAFGVVTSGRLLNIRKPRSVLDMEQRSLFEIPRHEVGTPSELVVLVRLVNADDKPTPGHAGLELTRWRSAPGRPTDPFVQSVLSWGQPDSARHGDRERPFPVAASAEPLRPLSSRYTNVDDISASRQFRHRPAASHAGIPNLQTEARPRARVTARPPRATSYGEPFVATFQSD